MTADYYYHHYHYYYFYYYYYYHYYHFTVETKVRDIGAKHGVAGEAASDHQEGGERRPPLGLPAGPAILGASIRPPGYGILRDSTPFHSVLSEPPGLSKQEIHGQST